MPPQQPETPGRIVIIRHAEKPGDQSVDNPSDGPNLSLRGFARAAALAFHIPESLALPDFLIAAQSSSHSERPVQTVLPLSQRLQLPINEHHADKDFAALAAKILGDSKYSGKMVLICWHHGKIPQLASALGTVDVPAIWPGDVFDRFWQITFVNGEGRLSDLPQKLLFGDNAV